MDELEIKENVINQEQINKNTSQSLLQELEVSSEERNNREQAELIKKNEGNFIAKLECGHSFHSKCISEWMTKNNNCPVCREKIDKEECDSSNEKNRRVETNTNSNSITSTSTTTEVLIRSLINIQSSIHPELSSLDYSYGSNFSWRYPQSSSTSNSSYSYDRGSDSGGASSKW